MVMSNRCRERRSRYTPALSSDHLNIETFEGRMRFRRRMVARYGVSVAALHAAADLALIAQESVKAWTDKAFDNTCVAWLKTSPASAAPPSFCGKVELVLSLRHDEALAWTQRTAPGRDR